MTREEVIELLSDIRSGFNCFDPMEKQQYHALSEAIKALQECKMGKWIDSEPDTPDWSSRKNGMAYYCSVCKHSAGKNKHRTYKYCPWCGTKMDGGADDD